MKLKYTKCEGCGQRDYKVTEQVIICNYCGLMYDKPVEVKPVVSYGNPITMTYAGTCCVTSFGTPIDKVF